MTDFKRTIKCSNCNNESNISLNSELDLREVLVSGKCSRCGASMQVSYGIIGESSQNQSKSDSADTPLVNIDDTLFTPEIPSDTLRDLMED